MIERMRYGARQPRGCPARKLCVGIESQDVANVPKHIDTARFDRKCIGFPGKKRVQVEQLAALALPAHPHSLALIEGSMTVEKKKGTIAARAVFCIQLVDKLDREFYKGMRIAIARHGHGIGKISQQRKVQKWVAI